MITKAYNIFAEKKGKIFAAAWDSQGTARTAKDIYAYTTSFSNSNPKPNPNSNHCSFS